MATESVPEAFPEVVEVEANPDITEEEEVFRGHFRRMNTTGEGEVDRRANITGIFEVVRVAKVAASGDAIGITIVAKTMDVSIARAMEVMG